MTIDRRSLCSGRIHYKITLEVCLQVGQVLSSIKLYRTMFCMRGCSIHDLPRISTEQLGSLGTQESDSPRENKFRQIDDQGKLPMIRVSCQTIRVSYLIRVSYPNGFSYFPLSQPQMKPCKPQILVTSTP